MPKKQKQAEQKPITVEVDVTMPGRNTGSIDNHMIGIDPDSLELGDPPTVEQVAKVARAAVLDALQVEITVDVAYSFPNDVDEITVALEGVEDALVEQAKERAADQLKVKVRNGREALAAIKAHRKAKVDAAKTN